MPWSDVIGHAPVVTLLRRAVALGRVPQSLLFAGPEGVGKRAVAMALAQAVNCPKRRDDDPCGVCSICRRIARGQFSDLVILDKGDEPSIKIRMLRERVLDAVGYRPFEGARRIYIIDPADEMTPETQDALLKTLEEPPPAAILMLITAYPDTLLPTIQSRCRRLRFAPLSDADVARVLVERHQIELHAARALASASGGSVGRALAEQQGELEEDREAALAWLTAMRGGPTADRLKASAALAQHHPRRRARDVLATRLAIVQSLLRDLAALSVGGAVPLSNADLEAPLRSLSPAFGLDRVVQAFDALQRAENVLQRNAGPKIVADWLGVSV
jgi:DNA polymerase-3 subunit delta'